LQSDCGGPKISRRKAWKTDIVQRLESIHGDDCFGWADMHRVAAPARDVAHTRVREACVCFKQQWKRRVRLCYAAFGLILAYGKSRLSQNRSCTERNCCEQANLTSTKCFRFLHVYLFLEVSLGTLELHGHCPKIATQAGRRGQSSGPINRTARGA